MFGTTSGHSEDVWVARNPDTIVGCDGVYDGFDEDDDDAHVYDEDDDDAEDVDDEDDAAMRRGGGRCRCF